MPKPNEIHYAKNTLYSPHPKPVKDKSLKNRSLTKRLSEAVHEGIGKPFFMWRGRGGGGKNGCLDTCRPLCSRLAPNWPRCHPTRGRWWRCETSLIQSQSSYYAIAGEGNASLGTEMDRSLLQGRPQPAEFDARISPKCDVKEKEKGFG